VTNPKAVFIGLILALFCTSRAQAQVTIDVSKVTCRQFILYEVTKPEYIAIWIHGYYSGRAVQRSVLEGVSPNCHTRG